MGTEDTAKIPGQSPSTSRKSSTDDEKELEKAGRKESLKQAGRKDSKTGTQGQEAPGTKDTASPSPLPEETKMDKPPELSASMVNDVLKRLNEMRSQQSNSKDK